MFQSTENLNAKMLPTKSFVLVLTLVACAVVAVHGEEETTGKPSFADAAKEKWRQGVDAAKSGFAKAEEAFNNAKEKGGESAEFAALEPFADFVMGIKEKGMRQMKRNESIQLSKIESENEEIVDQVFKREIGPMASNFSSEVKEKWNEGVQKVEGMYQEAKDAISSHVSPFVNKVRKGMLDGVRNLRDKLHKKGNEPEEAADSSEKATVKAEINSKEDGA